MQYAENQELIDSRTGDIVTIDLIVPQDKGMLYTVKYSDDKYRRYYEYRLKKLFIPLTNETYIAEPQPQDYKNVEFVDFFNRSKFANFDSWYTWVNKYFK